MSVRNTFAATRRSHGIMKWLQDGEDVTIQRVMDTYGVKYPQAREDLKLLEELYLLSTHRDGRTKVWRWAGFNPDYISVATAAALELGAIALDLFDGTPYVHEIERLAEHCRSRVGPAQRDRLDRVSGALHLRRTWLPVEEQAMAEHTEMILDAVFRSRGLAMQYARADGAVRHYIVIPQRLIWYASRLWLLANHENHPKLFDVAGIVSLEDLRGRAGKGHEAAGKPAGEAKPADEAGAQGASTPNAQTLDPVPVKTDEDLEEYFKNAFGIYAQNFPVADVHLEVGGAWANYLRRYRIHPSQRNEESDGALHVHLRLGLCPEFRTFVLGMIPDVRVHAPQEFVEELDHTIREWLERKR